MSVLKLILESLKNSVYTMPKTLSILKLCLYLNLYRQTPRIPTEFPQTATPDARTNPHTAYPFCDLQGALLDANREGE